MTKYNIDGNVPTRGQMIVDELFVNNRVVQNITDNVIPVSASNATSLDCSKGSLWRYTPTEATTITPKNFAPGQEITLIITTSGTSSFTITFGTPFKVTGTLASGTADAKVFVVKFVAGPSGTTLYEVSRTTAM